MATVTYAAVHPCHYFWYVLYWFYTEKVLKEEKQVFVTQLFCGVDTFPIKTYSMVSSAYQFSRRLEKTYGSIITVTPVQ